MVLGLDMEDAAVLGDADDAVAQDGGLPGGDAPRQQLDGVGAQQRLVGGLVVELLLGAGLAAERLGDQDGVELLIEGVGCGGQPGRPAAEDDPIVHPRASCAVVRVLWSSICAVVR